MKPLNRSAFTIIETMLFLGITGLLVVGILVGSGTSINIQRYRDSVNSLQAILQNQYSNVSNTINDRNDNWACHSGSSPNQTVEGAGVAIGRSNCVILGKYITSNETASGLIIRDVVGYIPDDVANNLNEIEIFRSSGYDIKISDTNTEEYFLEWNSTMKSDESNGRSDMMLSMLILKSPNSGTIRTFINSGFNNIVTDDNIQTMLTDSSLKQSAKICVDSMGLFDSARMAVFINASSSGASGVETLGDDSGC